MLFRLWARTSSRAFTRPVLAHRFLAPTGVRFFRGGDAEGDEGEEGGNEGGEEGEGKQVEQEGADEPDGPISELDDPYGIEVMEVQNEAARPGVFLNDFEEDAQEVENEIQFRMDNLKDLDSVISSDWILNQENGVYYNPETGETKVPYEISYEAYKARRAARARRRLVEDTNSKFPDYITPVEPTNVMQIYDVFKMDRMRSKYKDLDFKEVRKRLAEADSQYFAWPSLPNINPFGSDVAVRQQTDAEAAWEVENLKFLSLLPVKYHVKTYRVWHMTPLGKRWTFAVLLLGGTGKGWGGFGYGKGLTTEEATKKACRELRNNMMDCPLDEGRTITEDVKGKFKKTTIKMLRQRRGRGTKAGLLLRCIMECFGIEDITCKVHGSKNKNPLSVVYAAFQGLAQIKSPREKAMDRGVNVYKEYDEPAREAPPTPAEVEKRAEQVDKSIRMAAEMWAQRTDLHPSPENFNYKHWKEPVPGKKQKPQKGKYWPFLGGKPTNPNRPGWIN